MKALGFFLALCITFLSIQGCGSDAEAQDFEDANIELLATGEDPISGYDASKQIRVIDNATDLSLYWYDYTSETEPTVDFSNETVVIYDQGWIDGNTCASYARISSAENSVDETIGVSLFEVELTQHCPDPDIVCPAVIVDSRPYRIFKIPRTRELFIAENLDTEDC